MAGAYRATYDWTSMEPSTAVIETVADATGREPLALATLYDFIDSDALDSLFRSSDGEVSVSFTYAEHEVTVHSDGEVAVLPVFSGQDPGQ
ncbi:hypothetical protein GJ633_01840 [Halorubrum sp. CBA1125]|nr:hypothetical protein [Halorubrum sp. CBA1125]